MTTADLSPDATEALHLIQNHTERQLSPAEAIELAVVHYANSLRQAGHKPRTLIACDFGSCNHCEWDTLAESRGWERHAALGKWYCPGHKAATARES